jgi:hypothetical protein
LFILFFSLFLSLLLSLSPSTLVHSLLPRSLPISELPVEKKKGEIGRKREMTQRDPREKKKRERDWEKEG